VFASKIKVATTIKKANTMKIPVFVGLTLRDFFKSAVLVGFSERSDGEKMPVYGVKVEAPGPCPREECAGKGKLRGNGSYARQVIEGLNMVLVLIYRFRCGLCGKTISRPYSFLAPYRRFTGKLISRGIELYGGGENETSYREVCADLSIFEFEADENSQGAVKLAEVTAVPARTGKDGFCPARSTVFSWVDFVCKRASRLVQQSEKEVVLRNLDLKLLSDESTCVNENAYKAGLHPRYIHQQDKAKQLNRLTYGLAVGQVLVGSARPVVENLRAYFLESAEKCADLLSDVSQRLLVTHTFERSNV
jgi:hypothetical protein